jgi:3'-phosphoadenosine 5'-phosphosulfate sulfotransferase (PAPS reductase)/FAD synthetase
MIELDEYDIEPPADAIKTEPVPKPTPESEPVEIFEMDQVLGPFDRGVLFSGGDDSLVLTHLAMTEEWVDVVIHLQTNSAVPENTDYVRRVCREHHWPLLIVRSPMPLETFACRYGFPGAACHTSAYNYFKGRQLQYLHQQTNGNLKLLSGVRTDESSRRMRNIEAEVQYSSTDSGDFQGWWVSPLIDKSDSWMRQYREEHALPENPVAKRLHRSGDCNCLSFGHRDEELTLLEAEYPEFAEWLLTVEERVQEYRGRVARLEAAYPEVVTDVDERRKQQRPHPMRLTILEQAHPDVYAEIVSIDRETAVRNGRTEVTNYIGHGGLSSTELRAKLMDADTNQTTLCETCQAPAESVSTTVQRHREQAADELERTTQSTLGA